MKPHVKSFFGLVLCLVLLSSVGKAQAPAKLGSALKFGILAGAVAKASAPAYVYGLYGGLVSTTGFSGTSATPASSSDIQSALTDLASAKAQCSAYSGAAINSDLSGLSPNPGIYQIDTDAKISDGKVLTLIGTSESYFVFNIDGGMSLGNSATVRLIGVKPDHIFWNVKGDVAFAANTDASGLFLGGSSITTTAIQYGTRQLLALKDVLLNDLTQTVGTNSFYSAAVIAGGLTLGCTNPVPTQCDNQIINGDFENYSVCPSNYSNLSSLPNASDVCNFLRGGPGTSDYFNVCATSSTVAVPQNFATIPALGRTAHSGSAYTGAFCGNSSPGGSSEYREYIKQQLTTPLQANKTYYAEFWVSLASASKNSIRELGMSLSTSDPYLPTNYTTSTTSLPAPQVRGVPGFFPNTSSTDWYKINGVFTATSNFQYVTIGNFNAASPNNVGNGITPGSNPGSLITQGAYYFFDDLAIIELPTAGPTTVTKNCFSAPPTIGQGCPVPSAFGPATYQWSPTTGLSNPNQLITQASPAVTTTYTLTITFGGQTVQSTTTVIVNSVTPATTTVLGTPNATTTLSGTTAFSGNYLIEGDLLLTNGTFTLTPGTTFYFNNAPVAGQPTGKIIVGDNATLRLNNATIRGGCNSWYGIVLSQNYQNTHLIIENGSKVSNAKYGVFADRVDQTNWTPYDTQYTITNAVFENNLTHVYDESDHHAPASSCSIINSTFTSDPQLMLPPYNNAGNTSNGNQITYQALFINPFTYGGIVPNPATTANSGTVAVSGNLINTAVYGILNNRSNRGFVNVAGNTLINIYTIGIWKEACPGYDLSYNTVVLNGSNSINTTQISPNNPVVGIYAAGFSPQNGGYQVNSNSVAGDNAQNQTAFKEQIGITAPFEEVAVRDNTLITLSSGVTYSQPNLNVLSNRFTNCLVGLKLLPYDQSYGSNLRGDSYVACNTFERTSGFSATVYGILAMPQVPSSGPNYPNLDSYFPTLGSSLFPCGNSFSNIGTPAENNSYLSPNAQYYRVNSSQENISSSSNINVTPVNVVNTANFCQNRGASNGVNRQAPLILADVQPLMDSVRRQLVSAERQGAYQSQIIQYFVRNSDLAGLDAYAATLPTANKEATYTFNLYLLRTHADQKLLKQVQRARQQLLLLAANDGDLQQEIDLLDLLSHADAWLPVGERLPVADSLGLARIAASGATVAEQAATWLRYYYPHAAPYRERRFVPAPAARIATPRTALLQESELYPNPATSTVVVRYRAVRAGQSVSLQLFDLLTTRQVLDKQLPATASEAVYAETTVDLKHLPAGQYSYRFVVDGKAQAAHHLIIQK